MSSNENKYLICANCDKRSLVEQGNYAPNTDLKPQWACGNCGAMYTINPNEVQVKDVPVNTQEVVVSDETSVDKPELPVNKPVRTFSKSSGTQKKK